MCGIGGGGDGGCGEVYGDDNIGGIGGGEEGGDGGRGEV